MQEAIWAMQWDHQNPEEIQGRGPAVPWKLYTQSNVLAGKSDLKAVTKFCSLAVPTQQETEERESHMVTNNISFQAVAVGAEGRPSSEELLLAGCCLHPGLYHTGSQPCTYGTQIPRTYVKKPSVL